jgi:DNA mismatch repair ATPase MutS
VKIFIENQILEYDNDKNQIDNIFMEIDGITEKSSKTLSHMVIDGNEIVGDYYDYFLNNIKNINKIEVILLTYKELIEEILLSTLNYLKRTPQIIEGLANTFYKNPTKESWNDLNDLLEALSWIMNTFASIDQDHRLKDIILSYENWNLYAKEVLSLKEILANLEEALANNDYVSIADILSYEIESVFKEMEDKLSSLINREVNLYDLN